MKLTQVKMPDELIRAVRSDAHSNYRTVPGQIRAVLLDYYSINPPRAEPPRVRNTGADIHFHLDPDTSERLRLRANANSQTKQGFIRALLSEALQ